VSAEPFSMRQRLCSAKKARHANVGDECVMLKYKNVVSILAQSVQQDYREDAIGPLKCDEDESTLIISSILITSSGRPISSFHNSREPPVPRHDASKSITPYHVDRPMKTKVYGLFAAAIWEEYSSRVVGAKPSWLAVETDDALFVIRPVPLKSSDQILLLILVADLQTPVGVVTMKAKATADALAQGLIDFKVYD
jgi:hypothetical protein